MYTLLLMKQEITKFYARFEAFIAPALKFLAMLFTLIFINSNVGFMTKLKNPAIVLILSLICSFLPPNVIVILTGMIIVAHMYALSLECAVVVLFVLIIMYALYFRFTPKDAIAVMLTPISFILKMPYLMAFSMGFVGNPLSCISVGCGTAIYYILDYVKENQDKLGSSAAGGLDAESALSGFKTIIDGIIKNDDMIAMAISLSATIVIVYLIRRLKINYSWYIALGAGVVTGLVSLMVAGSVVDADISIGGAILGMLGAVVISLIIQFFVFNVDYSRAEYVQFEDDDYYYYVKAVPKINVEPVNSRRRRQDRDWDEDEDDDF